MTPTRLRAALVLALALLAAPLSSATPAAGRVVGTVTDATTGEPLIGASVVVVGTSIGDATDIDGRYEIPNAPAGEQTLRVSYVGYQTQEVPVVVVDGERVEVDVALSFATLEGVEITAQAEGQLNAINEQLSSNTITNVVSAARIQEIPDVNAAESIGRLPGVSIQRSGGEATRVAIRGLSPKFNTVTVNGVRLPATGGDDRSVDLSLVSSNILDGIAVTKAITPDMDADAIGGSIDLRLREAPERPTLDVLAQGGYNEIQDSYGNYKVVASASDRFFGDRLGIIASVNTDDYDRSADKFSAGYARGADDADGNARTIPASVQLREESIARGRTGASGVLDYRIPLGKITANAFYNRLSFDGTYRVNDINVQSQRNYFNTELAEGTTSIFSAALGAEQNFGWGQYDVSLARTSSEAETPERYTWQFGQEGGVLGPDCVINESTVTADVPYCVEADSTFQRLTSIYVYDEARSETQTMAQLNLQVPFALGDNLLSGYVKTGGKLRWLDRENDQQQVGRAGLEYGSGAGSLNAPLECIVAGLEGSSTWDAAQLEELIGQQGWVPISAALTEGFDRDNFLGGDYTLSFVPDTDMLLELTRALQGCEDSYREQPIGSFGRDYQGEEEYQAAYVMAELNLGRWLTVIPGVRYERDQSTYVGSRFREIVGPNGAAPPGEYTVIDTTRTNEFVLPMLHVNVRPTDWLQLRFARTETLSRPDYIQYAPLTTIDQYNSVVRAANTALRPSHSTNYDLSVSVFEDHIGLLSASVFTKEIEDYIIFSSFKLVNDSTFQSLFEEQFGGTQVPEEWYGAGASPSINTFQNNPYPARYRGLELDWQTSFWYLPSFLKGLVFNANYTYLFSEMQYEGYYLRRGELIRRRPPTYAQVLDDTLRVGRVYDQPTHVANVTLGYDVGGFSTRASFLYQTDTVANIDVGTPIFDRFTGSYYRFDLSVRQKLGNGLELFSNFNNITGRPDRNYLQGNEALPTYTEYYGLTVDVGARYRF